MPELLAAPVRDVADELEASAVRALRIAVNLRQYHHGRIGGIENYLRSVLAGLHRHRLTIWTTEEQAAHVREYAPGAEVVGMPDDLLVPDIRRALKTRHFDLFFCPLLVLEPLVVDIPSAAMIPDLQHEFFPEFFSPDVLRWRKENYSATARNVDVLFTNSQFSKSTIVDRYGIDPAKIRVVPHDVDEEFRTPNAPRNNSEEFSALKLPRKYLYFPANFWPHKNHSNVLRAMRLLLDRGAEDLHLVLSGEESTGAGSVRREVAELGLTERVRLIGFVDRPLVAEIYRNALALLFTTRFEGFGIPLLEAFHTGTPVITSRIGACEEVAGDAAEYADPEDPASIAAAVERVVSDEVRRRDLSTKGRQRAGRFSWRRMAEITEQAFRDITAQPGLRTPIEVREWPRFGLVTPSYNMAEFLEETIGSVLSQDYPNVDYLVMDGGSADGTLDILRKYDGRLRWRSEPDRGQGDAINKGFEAVQGEIFAFLNADDTYLPGALKTVAGHFRKMPNMGMIYGEAYHVDRSGAVIERYQTRPFDYDGLNEQCYICQPAAFLRRNAFVEAGTIDPSLHCALDYDLWIRVAKRCRVQKVDEYLATSRMYLDNKTLSSRRQVYREIIRTVRTHYGYVPYEWLNGYACALLDGKDQFFERSKPTLGSYALSLALGSYHNPRNIRRYWKDWARRTGFGGKFTGRWDDGWISSRYVLPQMAPPGSLTMIVKGIHQAGFRHLPLRVNIDGETVCEQKISQKGPFIVEADLPERLQAGGRFEVAIESGRTWRPFGGDYRRLSCVINSIEFAGGTGRMR